MLLARLPRGHETVLRIVRQRSGSPEDIKLAELALAHAFGQVYVTELKPLRAMKRETNRRQRQRDRDRMKRAVEAWKRRPDYPSSGGLFEEWQKLGDV